MVSICMYMHVHQPWRLKNYRVFDVGHDHNYFHTHDPAIDNAAIIRKVAEKSYRPTLRSLQSKLDRYPEISFALSFSGTALEQMQEYCPDVLKQFQDVVASGRVEILADTYYHSLSFFYSVAEFERQVTMHRELIQKLFGQTPAVFRNTELSYNNDLAHWADQNGYLGIMAEGWDPILQWRSPNFVYKPVGTENIKVLLKNYRLSDDIAFRFGNKAWKEWPMSAEKFARWVHDVHGNGNTINLFMDFETFGEHQWEDTGIFNFLEQMPNEVMGDGQTTFKTPTQTIQSYDHVGEFNSPEILTWADTDRDLTAWVGNDIQRSSIYEFFALEERVLKSNDPKLIEDWRRLSTSDHFYYMCTKWSEDGDVHAYFSPYQSPYDAHIAFMNALADVKQRLNQPSPLSV